MPAFARIIGIDYSGAETPTASLKGLRVYMAEGDAPPVEVRRRRARANTGPARASPNGLWSGWPRMRRRLSASTTASRFRCAISKRTDSSPTGPLSRRFPSALADRRRHIYVDFVRDGIRGNGAARMGNARWRRLTEERAGGAKSVFHFDVQGSVAKSTHAGIPWLRFIRQRLGARVHFWPFDGWDIPPAVPPSPRSIRRCGAAASPAKAARATSTTPSASPPGRRGRPGRQPRGVPKARPDARRARRGAGRGLDIGGSRPDPRTRSRLKWNRRLCDRMRH